LAADPRDVSQYNPTANVNLLTKGKKSIFQLESIKLLHNEVFADIHDIELGNRNFY
jgi:hypothetical protein